MPSPRTGTLCTWWRRTPRRRTSCTSSKSSGHPHSSKKKKNDGSGDDDGDDDYDNADIYQPGYTKDEYNKVSEMVEHVIHEELATDSKNPQQHIHRTELMHILNDYRKDLDDAVSTSYVRIVKK